MLLSNIAQTSTPPFLLQGRDTCNVLTAHPAGKQNSRGTPPQPAPHPTAHLFNPTIDLFICVPLSLSQIISLSQSISFSCSKSFRFFPVVIFPNRKPDAVSLRRELDPRTRSARAIVANCQTTVTGRALKCVVLCNRCVCLCVLVSL